MNFYKSQQCFIFTAIHLHNLKSKRKKDIFNFHSLQPKGGEKIYKERNIKENIYNLLLNK